MKFIKLQLQNRTVSHSFLSNLFTATGDCRQTCTSGVHRNEDGNFAKLARNVHFINVVVVVVVVGLLEVLERTGIGR